MSVHVTDSPADQLLDGLNPQQRQAVLHEGTPLLIVAGGQQISDAAGEHGGLA